MSGTQVLIKESAMSVDMQQDCADCAAHALHTLKLGEQNSIAQFVKKELDAKYGGNWQCIVGHSYGSCVGHDTQYFLYFEIAGLYFNVWKMEKSGAAQQSAAAEAAA